MSGRREFDDDNHFTINNIPFGVVSFPERPDHKRIATRIYGDVYVLADLIKHDLLSGIGRDAEEALDESTLNRFASLSKSTHRQVRTSLQDLFGSKSSAGWPKMQLCSQPIADVTLHLPMEIGDFTDFSCSQNHVLNASEAMTGTRMLPPGFLNFPIGYAGRCSSIVPSGMYVSRPMGQYRDESGNIVFGPSRRLDFELEVGVVISRSTVHGDPVSVENADDHIFGLVLINDWSARDIQALEMNPLGPLNGKSFCTSISPWIVTLDALESFTCPIPPRDSHVKVAEYLQAVKDSKHYTIQLQADIITATATVTATTTTTTTTTTRLCKVEFESLYWPIDSLVAHQTINGCPLSTGNLLGTGTVSGSSPGSYGCLLEATRGGKQAVTLSDGEERVWLQDGDGVRLTGWAGELGSDDCVGFGECFGRIRASGPAR